MDLNQIIIQLFLFSLTLNFYSGVGALRTSRLNDVTRLSLVECTRGRISPSDPPLSRFGNEPAGGIIVGIIMAASAASLCGTVLASNMA